MSPNPKSSFLPTLVFSSRPSTLDPPMTRLDRYILKEALPIFGFGLVLYAVLALLSNFLPRAEFLGTARIVNIVQWLFLQLPQVITQMLPVAVLLAVMLTFGRLARENELMVLQAGGISVWRTARVFMLGGVLLSLASLALNEFVVPWANRASVLVYWNALVPERTAMFRLVGQDLEVGSYRLRFEGYDKAKDQVVQVRLESWKGQEQTVILAESARLDGTRIVFRDYKTFTLDFAQLPLPPDFKTVDQVAEYLQKVFKTQNLGAPGAELGVRLSLSRQDLEARYSGGGFADATRLSQWWAKITNPQTAPKDRLAARANFHSGIALSLANLMVLILALPIAVGRASSPGTALGLALLLTIVYYVAFSVGKVAALNSNLPELAAWGANLLGAGVGWWLGRKIYR